VKKSSTPVAASFHDIHPGGAQGVDLADGDAVHAIHHHHVIFTVIPVHLGHHEQRRTQEVAPQLRAVGRFAHEVEFVLQVFLEFRHHFARTQAFAVGKQLFQQPGGSVEQFDIVADDPADPRAQYLDGNGLAVVAGGRNAPGRPEAAATGVASNSANTSVSGFL